MTLSTRISIAMVSITLATAVLVGMATYRHLDAALRPALLNNLAFKSSELAHGVYTEVVAASADVRSILETPTFQAMVRAELSGGVDQESGLNAMEARRRMEALLLGQVAAKPHYVQFRIIGAAKGGRELVRVDKVGDLPTIIAEEGLQEKGDRDYFKHTIGLPAHTIGLSPIELNREHGVISEPYLPVLRVSTPIVLEDGSPFGIVIINLDMNKAFDEIRAKAEPGSQVYAINPEGDYLLHPDPSMEFGVDLGARHRIQDDFPNVPDAVDHTATELYDVAGKRVVAAMTLVRPNGHHLMTIVDTMPYSKVMEALRAVRNSAIAAGLGAAITAALIALLLARSLIQPLRQITDQIENFDHVAPLELSARAPGEIGVLGRAFTTMAGQVLEKTTALEAEIDARKRTEAELYETLKTVQIYSAVVASSNDAIIVKDLDGVILGWNPAAERLYGYTEAEAVGQSVLLIIPAEREHEFGEIMTQVRRGSGIQQFETVRRHCDGHLLDISLTVSPVLSHDGEVVGASSIAHDITEKLATEEKFRLVVESAPNGVILVDEAGCLQLVNAETERLFGYPRSELLGQPLDLLIPEEIRTEHTSHFSSFVAAPESRRMGRGRDLFGRHVNGTVFPIEVGLSPIKTRSGMMILAVIVDISERKEAEEAIRQYTEDLKQSNAELETFAYVASHDLQEPLRMVTSYVELLQKRYGGQLDEKADKYIFYAVDGAKRMKQLINDLLTYSRVSTQGREPAPTDTNEVLQRVLRGLEVLITETNATVTADELPEVLADPVQLGQAFQNLISNGIKFRGDEAPRVHISATDSGDLCEFTVRDNGIGIDEKYTERVFQMFQRLNARDAYEGTGIGLAVVKKIVERHGGLIRVISEPGAGASFLFTIPHP